MADQSLEEGELEKTIIATPENSAKRKLTEPRTNEWSGTMKKQRANSCSSSNSGSSTAFPKQQPETDPEILARRQKQIDFGKNTVGYDNYTAQVPKASRRKDQPRTPPMHLKYSRRAWDGMVKKWRIQLHEWDQEAQNDQTVKDDELRDDIKVEDSFWISIKEFLSFPHMHFKTYSIDFAK